MRVDNKKNRTKRQFMEDLLVTRSDTDGVFEAALFFSEASNPCYDHLSYFLEILTFL